MELTDESVQLYAERHGLEVINLTEPKLDLSVLRWRRRHRNLHLEKFQIYDLLQDFDRIFYLDADVLIRPDAPDIFKEVPANALGVVNEFVGVEAPKRLQEWKAMRRRLGGFEQLPPHYFNAGVMVASRAHRDVFSYHRDSFATGRWPDQNTLNYEAHISATTIHWLDPKWNCMPAFGQRFENAELRRQSWMIHYAGESAKSLLLEDLEHFYQPSAVRAAC